MRENRAKPAVVASGIAAVGGAVVLATVGAPQSLEYVLRTGLDGTAPAGYQIAVAASGTVGIAVALLLGRWWRLLLPAGTLGVFGACLAHLPAVDEVTARLAGDPNPPLPDIVAHPVAACVLAAASGVLLAGLLGAAQHLTAASRIGTAVTGLVACAAYYGVAVTGPLIATPGVVRLTVVAVLTAVSAMALYDRTEDVPPTSATWPAAVVAALLPVVPTVFVAAMRQPILGTTTGWITGLLLTALALSVSGGARTALAVTATGLVLAAPVTLLLFTHSAPAHSRPVYAWPLALLGVLAGAALTLLRRRLTAAAVLAFLAAVPMVLLGTQIADGDRATSAILAWTFVTLTLAAIAATAGAVAPGENGRFPAYGVLSLIAGIGLTAVSALFSTTSGSTGANANSLLGPHTLYVSAGYVVVAGILLAILSRLPQPREEPEEEPLEALRS